MIHAEEERRPLAFWKAKDTMRSRRPIAPERPPALSSRARDTGRCILKAQSGADIHWAAVMVWVVVNAVNVLQALGFLSRVRTGSMAANHALGYAIIGLAIPAALALAAFIRARAGWLHAAGPGVFLGFVLLMVVVDYAAPVEFRSPARHGILVPYLLLFFGSILLMGLPMFRLDRRLWLVTVATSAALVGAMIAAMRAGVG